MELETDRLILRRWTETDSEPFAAINADESVMQYKLNKDEWLQNIRMTGDSFSPSNN